MSSARLHCWIRKTAGLCAALAALLVPALATIASASEEHANVFEPWMEFSRILNFVILVAVLWFFLRKPVSTAMANRRKEIERAMKEAEEARAEARRLREEYEQRTADLEKELAEIRAQAQADREALRERLLREGSEAAEHVLEQARLTIEQETQKAERQIRSRAAMLALDLAEKSLEKELGPDDQRRFTGDYIKKVGEVN